MPGARLMAAQVDPDARALRGERHRHGPRARGCSRGCATSPTRPRRGCGWCRRGSTRGRARRARPGARARHLRAPTQAASMARAVAELRRRRREVTVALGALDERRPRARARDGPRRPARGGQVREPERAARAAPPARCATGWSWSTTTSSCRAASSTGSSFVCERFGFQLAQPALRHTSHAAWRVFRRRALERSRAARGWSRSAR